MRRVYFLIYNDDLGTRSQIKRFLDAQETIDDWRYDIPGLFYLISELTADELCQLIRNGLKQEESGARFIVSEVSRNRQGWLPRDTWKFLRLSDSASETD